MTDAPIQPAEQPDPATAVPGPPPPPAYDAQPGAQPGMQPYAAPGAVATGPIGNVRSTGTCILLFIVTLGIYGWFWYYNSHEEMKRHSGEGIGGVLALVLGIFVSIVMVFLSPHEIGKLYERRGQQPPVSALTGLWVLLPLVGGIVWFVKTNGALNDYWRSLGAH
jgi:Domain of unknown function (DUF4234)